ncbi:MAG: helix-turn-helix domain-containing protein [Bacteroidota bacterium]
MSTEELILRELRFLRGEVRTMQERLGLALVGPAEARKILGIGRSTLSEWVRKGKLEAVLQNGKRMYRMQDLEEVRNTKNKHHRRSRRVR